MTDLFVSEDGTDIRICKKDEDGRERVIAYIGSPEGVESPDDWAETADEVLAEWRYYARLFAQAEKLGRALAEICREIDKYPIRTRICDTNLHYMKMRAREELRTGNDDET